MVKVKTRGKNEGDVEFTVALDGDASGGLTVGTLGGGLNGQRRFTATISLDAQNGYKPDKLVLKGNAGYTGSLDTNLLLEGDELKDISRRSRRSHCPRATGRRPGAGGLRRARPDDPENLAATLAGAHQPGQNARPLALALDEDGTLGFDTYDLATSETRARSRSASASAAGVAAAPAARPRATAAAWCASPGGTFEPRICKQPS